MGYFEKQNLRKAAFVIKQKFVLKECLKHSQPCSIEKMMLKLGSPKQKQIFDAVGINSTQRASVIL